MDQNNSQGNTQIERAQKQVDEVVQIMQSNVESIITRGDNLNQLDQRAQNLSLSANEFQTTSRKIKRKYWWKNLKMMIIMGILGVLILVIIIVSTVGIPSSSGDDTTTPSPAIPTTPKNN